jgi:hypothetical protein
MTHHFSRLLMAFAAIVCFVCPAQSEPNITQAVSQDCRWDYHNFCSDYGIGSPLLNYCFLAEWRQAVQGLRQCADSRWRRIQGLCAGPTTGRPLSALAEFRHYGTSI